MDILFIKCPTCKLNFTYKINNQIKDLLNNIPFRCMFRNEGCNGIISYTEHLNYINNCNYNYNDKYICKIKKYNYTKKILKFVVMLEIKMK